MTTRTESDSLGTVEVPAARAWGAQTQRALAHFPTDAPLPRALIHAYAAIKQAAAETNGALGLVPCEIAAAIAAVAADVARGTHDDEFPLGPWQSGSGTQTNMNLNEVLANLASETLGGGRGAARRVHPNDHVNRGQSTNDTFPTAMHVAVVVQTHQRLLPALAALQGTFSEQAVRWADVVKTGRTHLMDATPVTLGQECQGWASQLDAAHATITAGADTLRALPLGGTAVGNGLNTHPEFAVRAIRRLGALTGEVFTPAHDRLALTAAHDGLVHVSAALRQLAVALIKIANDVRWLGSGPRCGLGELTLPANEPGSSIMPGKVNPSQAEALIMACTRVIGGDTAVAIAGSQGNFELNVTKPLIADTVLRAIGLLADMMTAFDAHCARGIAPDQRHVDNVVGRSLMLVTALAPTLGYDNAAEIAHRAHTEGTTLREAAAALGYLTGAQYDALIDPRRMAKPDAG